MGIEEKLKAMGLAVKEPSGPRGKLAPAVRSGTSMAGPKVGHPSSEATSGAVLGSTAMSGTTSGSRQT